MNTSTSSSKLKCDELLNIYKFKNSTDQVKGFFLKSTAPENVEDDNDIRIPPDCKKYFLGEYFEEDTIDTGLQQFLNQLPQISRNFFKEKIPNNLLVKSIPRTVDPEKIEEIVNCLTTSNEPEIVVRIHGYSTPEDGAIKSYYQMIENIKNYRQAQPIDIDKTFIFLGYRWPSEKPNKNNWLEALPILPRLILGFSFFGIIVCTICLLFDLLNKISLILLSFLIAFFFFAIVALILLRFTAYFRDTFRATNYGVPDLVELIRTLDKAVMNHNDALDDSDKKDYKKEENKIELSFIAHSMGSYVTTNTVRILSDVFTDSTKKETSISYVGNIFSLGRLVLVAPDIPVETIMPRRANFLQSSLRRFKESYIFSNEGDVVLRLASTAANYFSFPARDRFSGYRLGNITAQHSDEPIKYGISNLDPCNPNRPKDPFYCLEIRSSEGKKTLEDFIVKNKENDEPDAKFTNKFTYFDCTDYTDIDPENGKEVTPVSLAAKKKGLNSWNYLRLFIDHLLLHKIDTHGGYFTGYFSRELMYKLAFLGFDGLLKSYSSEAQKNGKDTLFEFSQKCKEKQIQVVLSSDRKLN